MTTHDPRNGNFARASEDEDDVTASHTAKRLVSLPAEVLESIEQLGQMVDASITDSRNRDEVAREQKHALATLATELVAVRSRLDGQDTVNGQVLAALARIEASGLKARDTLSSVTNEHDIEIDSVRKLAEAQRAELEAVRKLVAWKVGATISGGVAFAGALWKVFELLHPLR